jgi:ubiquinone/menaquinone biosynthesis C-methylase UbiE
MPEGTASILNTRTLQTAHKRLAELVQPGMRVLDVGCGTGAITWGIAEKVGEQGRVVGVDLNTALIEQARAQQVVGEAQDHLPQLFYEVYDLYQLPYRDNFDIVTAARVLQWLSRPEDALQAMVRATKPGGRVLVLDYNHEKIAWNPDPPRSMGIFYDAFLMWRDEAGMDNGIADELWELFARAGLQELHVTPQHEVARRGQPDFETRMMIWAEVAATRGHQMVTDGIITEAQRAAAEADYRAWIRDEAESQTLYLLAVEGVRLSLDEATEEYLK